MPKIYRPSAKTFIPRHAIIFRHHHRLFPSPREHFIPPTFVFSQKNEDEKWEWEMFVKRTNFFPFLFISVGVLPGNNFVFFGDFLSLLRTYAISHSGDYRFPISFFNSLHVYNLMKHVATGMLQRARDAHGVPTSLYTLTLLFITCLGMKLSLGLTFC